MVHAYCEGLNVLSLLQGAVAPWLSSLDGLPRFLSQGQRLDSFDHQVVVGPGHGHAGVGHDPIFELRDGPLKRSYGQMVLALVCLGLDASLVQFLSESLELQFEVGSMVFLAYLYAAVEGTAARLREQVWRDDQGDKPNDAHGEDKLVRLHVLCSEKARHR
jgi:hypothetical protein